MNHNLFKQQVPSFLVITISMMTCLILLINVSFKIINFQGLIFSVNSLLCPLIAGFYLLALRNCSFNEQRHILNISLMTLYLFCLGVYLLVNLPAAEYMHGNPVYQIVFEDIPKKFFATTISFVLSFYLPHVVFCNKTDGVLSSPRQCVLKAVLGGLSFFCMNFYFLFSEVISHSFKHIFIDSLMIASLCLLIMGVIYLSFLLGEKQKKQEEPELLQKDFIFPLYEYFLVFAVAVMLMCVACEYRIIAFSKEGILAASALFFPITLIISTLIGEIWGYRANLKLTCALIVTQIIFDALLMGLIALPSPPFFNLNPFYSYIMPRRLPAASLSLFVSFMCNSMLLNYLKHSKWEVLRPWRILIANVCANSLLCLVDYSLLFGGIYPYEQVINLGVNVWEYKLITSLVLLPVVLWLCKSLEKNTALIQEN